VAGLLLGGVAAALALVVVGSLVRAPLPVPVRYAAAAVAAVALLAREFGIVRFPVPQNARQVPQFVARVPFWGTLQFGAEMGTGMRTFSPTGLPHIVAVAILLFAAVPAAVLAGVGFAAGRTLMLLTFLAARDRAAADDAFTTTLPGLRPLFAAAAIVPLVGTMLR
jgi:hypothetical protein